MATAKKTAQPSTDNVSATKVAGTTVEKVEPKKFENDDLIPCRSITQGQLIGTGKKSEIFYSWEGYGDVVEVEYADLRAWKSMHSGYIYRPCFVIEDDELLAQWPDVKELTEKIERIDCDAIFDMPLHQYERALRNIPTSYNRTIVNIANSKIQNGTLDSISKIKLFDSIFGTELMFLVD